MFHFIQRPFLTLFLWRCWTMRTGVLTNLQICIWSNYPAPSIAGMSSILTVIGKITFATQPLPQRRVSWNTKFKFNTIFFCLFDSIVSFLALLVNKNLWPGGYQQQHEQLIYSMNKVNSFISELSQQKASRDHSDGQRLHTPRRDIRYQEDDGGKQTQHIHFLHAPNASDPSIFFFLKIPQYLTWQKNTNICKVEKSSENHSKL